MISSVVMPNHVHRSIRATPELAFAKASPELEKLYLTQNKLAAKSARELMATGLRLDRTGRGQ